MKTRTARWILCAAAAALLCAGCGTGQAVPEKAEIPVLGEDYLKSAHYFADGWCLNFWNCELDQIDSQLDQIQADGFNSIILVIPWRELQPDIETMELNDYAAQQLAFVLEKAQEHQLGVVIRPGYTWDYYEDDSVLPRYYQLLGNEDYQDAWISYLTQIYEICQEYDSFLGGFLCWEDFWTYTYTAKSMGAEKLGAEEAEFIGYHQYLEERFTLEQINEWYGENFTDYSQIYFPGEDNPALRLFFDFYDDFLNRLLARSQQVFPNLSMEVRLDGDLAVDQEGTPYYYSHEATYSCQDSEFTTVMYGIPMGFANQGERVDYQTAMNKTDEILSDLLKKNDGKGVYVDQFLYADNTPGFSHNAQIIDDQVDDYLENIHTVLGEKTIGYGVWTYRDYAVDLLYNPQFGLGLEGWESSGAETVETDGSAKVLLEAGGWLRQNIPADRKTDTGEETMFVRGEYQNLSGDTVTLTVTLGNAEPATMECGPGESREWELTFPNTGDYTLNIQSDGEVYIDNLKVYAHVQNGLLYSLDGEELDCIESIRVLNSKLQKVR